MELNLEQSENLAVVEVGTDSLDAGNADELKTKMSPIIEKNPKVLLDLNQVTFVDSSGLGAILSCMRQLNGKNGTLCVCEAQKPVRALFELVRFHRIIDIFNTRSEALNSQS